MKVLITKISLGVLLFFITFSQMKASKLDPFYQIRVVEENQFVIELNPFSSDVEIELSNELGQILESRKVKKKSETYRLKFILSDIQEGYYNLTIENEQLITKMILKKAEEWIELDKKTETIYKPTFTIQQNILDINFLNSSLDDISISIEDEQGETVFIDQIKDQFTLHKRYKLSQLPSARYTFSIQVGSYYFEKEIKVEQKKKASTPLISKGFLSKY